MHTFEVAFNCKIILHGTNPSNQDKILNFKIKRENVLRNEKFIDKTITDYITFENIQEDYNLLAENLIFDVDNKRKQSNTLSKLKSNNKKIKKHYSFYYDYETRIRVEKAFNKTIEKFNYKFEKE